MNKAIARGEAQLLVQHEKDTALYRDIVMKHLRGNAKDIEQKVYEATLERRKNIYIRIRDGHWLRRNRIRYTSLSQDDQRLILMNMLSEIRDVYDNQTLMLAAHWFNTNDCSCFANAPYVEMAWS